ASLTLLQHLLCLLRHILWHVLRHAPWLRRLRLLWRFGRGRSRGGCNRRPHLQKTGKHGAVRRAKSATGVPSRSRIVAHVVEALKTDAIVPNSNVVERSRVGCQRVKLRIHESDSAAQLLVDSRDQRRPQGSDGAGATLLYFLSIDQNVVT